MDLNPLDWLGTGAGWLGNEAMGVGRGLGLIGSSAPTAAPQPAPSPPAQPVGGAGFMPLPGTNATAPGPYTPPADTPPVQQPPQSAAAPARVPPTSAPRMTAQPGGLQPPKAGVGTFLRTGLDVLTGQNPVDAYYKELMRPTMQAQQLREMGALNGALAGFANGGQGGTPQAGGAAPTTSGAPGGAGGPNLQNPPQIMPTAYDSKTGASFQFMPSPERRLAGIMSLMGGDFKGFADYMSPKASATRDGFVLDENSGQVIGVLPKVEYDNGVRVDRNDPNAPSFVPNVKAGYEPTYDKGGNIVGEQPLKGALKAESATAEAEARGKAGGAAAYETTEVPEIDDNGQPTGRMKVIRKSDLPSYSGAIGVKQSPADETFAKGQTDALNKTVQTASDPLHQQQLEAQIQGSRSAIQLANQVRTGKFTGNLSNLSQVMQSLGIKGNVADYANSTALLEQALDQQVGNAFQTYHNIRNEREFNLVKSTVGRISDPGDRLRYRAALYGALTNQEKAYGQFASAYAADPRTPKTQAALDQAWQKAGPSSLFADPIWQGVSLFGKPAVVISKDGKHGVFGYGTPMQQVFTVH